MVRTLLLGAITLAILGFSLPSAAHHPQNTPGDSIAFDHGGGNEWWVEVRLVGSDGYKHVKHVSARDDDQAKWVRLELKDWGVWAGSFHIEPEHRLRFRAVLDDGTKLFSCQFTHPDGLEQCNERARYEFQNGITPARGSYREYTLFDHLAGDESRVKVKILGTHPNLLDDANGGSVTARAQNHDDPTRLERTGWRIWEGPFDTPASGSVEFFALQGGSGPSIGQASCWFTHPAGVERCAGGEEDFLEAEFTGVTGNEWWVQTNVDASKPIEGVSVRVDDGDSWVALEERSWGAWAASFHVPDGSHIQFRAQATDGSWDLSEAAWRWPDHLQVPVEGMPAVAFHDVHGNQFELAVTVHANEHVRYVFVEERNPSDEPGPWENYLRPQESGEWSGSINVEPGHDVRIWAYTGHGGDGGWHSSQWYDWPCGGLIGNPCA